MRLISSALPAGDDKEDDSTGLIYKTNSWNGGGKQSFYHNEYFDDGDVVRKVKVRLFKFFDGHESSWERDEREVERWSRDDPGMPVWLRKLLG